MKTGLFVFIPLAALLAAPALAEEKKAEAKPAAAAPKKAAAADKDAEMKAWMAYGTPGEPHKKMEAMAGKWTVKVKAQMDPSQPAEETEGSAEFTMILGGRFLQEKFEGKMMGQPFSGQGLTAYDNYKKKYIVTWVDSSVTGIMTMTGNYDKSGKVLTCSGTMDDVVAKKPSKMKSVATYVDADHVTFEMWMPAPDGKMWKGLEMHYTRQK